MVRVSFVSAALLIAGCVQAWAQYQTMPHSEAQDRACRGDAQRLCRDAMPDEFRIASCLQMNRDRVSRGCRAAMQSQGM
jgi:hypothetical protein